MDQNDSDDEIPAVRSTKRSIILKKRVAKKIIKANKKLMYKKAIDVLGECKSSPSKEDAEDEF